MKLRVIDYGHWIFISPGCFISRDVTFDDSIMYKDVVKCNNSDACNDSSLQKFQIEVEDIESNLDSQPSVASTFDRDPLNVTSFSNIGGGAGQWSSSSAPHSLARDKTRRQIIPPVKYITQDPKDLSAFVFLIEQQDNLVDPLSYNEGMSSLDKFKWIKATEDEMDSFYKNYTWIQSTNLKGKVQYDTNDLVS